MTDRIPTYPGRVKLTPVTGQTNVYDLDMADSPSVLGTALNKATLLTDATAAAIATLEGTTPDTVNEALNALAAAFSPRARVETGSYVGTNTSGSGNPNSITLSFAPKLIIIAGNGLGVIEAGGGFSFVSTYNSGEIQTLTATVSGKVISWYHSSSYIAQLNNSSFTYRYVAIG